MRPSMKLRQKALALAGRYRQLSRHLG